MAKKTTAKTQADTGEAASGKTAARAPAKAKSASKSASAKKATSAKKPSKAASRSGTSVAGIEIPKGLQDVGAQIAKIIDTDVGRVVLAEVLVQAAKALSRTAAAREAVKSATKAGAAAGSPPMGGGPPAGGAGGGGGGQA